MRVGSSRQFQQLHPTTYERVSSHVLYTIASGLILLVYQNPHGSWCKTHSWSVMGYCWASLHDLIPMAGPKSLLTELGFHHRLESFVANFSTSSFALKTSSLSLDAAGKFKRTEYNNFRKEKHVALLILWRVKRFKRSLGVSESLHFWEILKQVEFFDNSII